METFVIIHRHDQFSSWDGFDTAKNSAKYAKEMNQIALGLTNHGNTCGLIEHYVACNDAGIKPILGVEAYFQPVFDQKKSSYHLNIIAKNKKGYQNMSQIITRANRDNFYRKPIVDFEILKDHKKGLIVTSACVVGIIAKYILGDKKDKAEKMADKFLKLFGEDFYIEVMPVRSYDPQKFANIGLIELAKKKGIPVIITTDSHFVRKEDYDTYLTMHKLQRGNTFNIDYSQMYMPTEEEVIKMWKEHMKTDCSEFIDNTKSFADKCNCELKFEEMVPQIDWGIPSEKKLTKLAYNGLLRKKKTTPEYKAQIDKELKVIFEKKFADYFLMVYDIIKFAKKNDIGVGFGRGSVCGSLLAYSIGLTNVDPLILGTNFERFLRPNKNTMPDIDTDFETERRGEVIDYLLQKYQGKAAQIANKGKYQIKNLANDLGKLYEMDKGELEKVKSILVDILEGHEEANLNELLRNKYLRVFNVKNKNFLKHFCKLYGQVRFFGKHAAGVAVTADDISKYVAIMRIRNGYQTSYDLDDLGKINVVKMDILGLTTMSVIKDAEKLTGTKFKYKMLNDDKIYERFRNAETDGIFQFEKDGAKDILKRVQPEDIQDLIACTALNRPAPIQLGILDKFIDGKNGNADKSALWYDYTKDTYGTIVYQEHVMNICRNLAKMEWDDVDKVMKNLRKAGENETEKEKELRLKFVKGAVTHGGLKKEDAKELWAQMTLYLFNKGHGAGYTLISFYVMWLKTYYPLEFYYALLKNEFVDAKRETYKSCAVKDGIVIFLPHVNGKAQTSIKKFDGEKVLQEGLSSIKGVGLATAKIIEELGPYKNMAEFIGKVPKRKVNSRVVAALENAGALEFDKDKFLKRVVRWNGALYGRAPRN